LALGLLLLAAAVLLVVVVAVMLRVGRQPIAQDAADEAASTRVADLALPRRRRRHAACKQPQHKQWHGLTQP
jgi:hypothetical protein